MNFKKNILYKAIKNVYIDFVKHKKSVLIRKKGYELLQTISAMFDSLGIIGYVYYGTLLGFVRDDDFIKNDYDIDFCALIQNNDSIEIIRKKAKEYGFIIVSSCFSNNYIVEDSFVANNIRIDISYFRFDSINRIWWTYIVSRIDNEIKVLVEENVNMPTAIIKKNKNNCFFNFPLESRELVETIFGMDWRIPIKNMPWYEHPNLKMTTLLGEKTYYDYN